MKKWACLSDDRKYRYALGRIWEPGAHKTLVVIGLNPSTADETEDDPTIRRCIGFAKSFGCGGLTMLNLFGFRSTDPKGLRSCADPIGPENDLTLLSARMQENTTIVAAWGAHGSYLHRDREVRKMFNGQLHHLGFTKDGHPRHPLYLRSDTPIALWEAP